MAEREERLDPLGDRALEMIMRDVLDSLTELSLETAFSGPYADFEIIEISSRQKSHYRKETTPPDEEAEVIDFTRVRRAAG